MADINMGFHFNCKSNYTHANAYTTNRNGWLIDCFESLNHNILFPGNAWGGKPTTYFNENKQNNP